MNDNAEKEIVVNQEVEMVEKEEAISIVEDCEGFNESEENE